MTKQLAIVRISTAVMNAKVAEMASSANTVGTAYLLVRCGWLNVKMWKLSRK